MTGDLLVQLADRAAITDVLLTYAHAVDRQDFALARSCYHPDAVDNHGRYQGGVDGLIEFFETLGPALQSTTHQLGPPWIRLQNDLAIVETYCLYRRESRGASPEQAVMQGLRFLDRFERRDSRWAIAAREVVLDWEQSGAAVPDPPSGPTWSRGAFRADDPSARFPSGSPMTTAADSRRTPCAG
jgi:SnoaL-like domain